MRKVTKQVVEAFLARTPRTVGNTHTDGHSLFLHGNRIAEHLSVDRYCIRVTLAGWDTPTTREQLNGLPGVAVFRVKGQTCIQSQAAALPWDGSWFTIQG